MRISVEMEIPDVAKILLQHAREYGFVNEHAELHYVTGEVMGDVLICTFDEKGVQE